jgi:hypothetical protein
MRMITSYDLTLIVGPVGIGQKLLRRLPGCIRTPPQAVACIILARPGVECGRSWVSHQFCGMSEGRDTFRRQHAGRGEVDGVYRSHNRSTQRPCSCCRSRAALILAVRCRERLSRRCQPVRI